MWSSYDDHFICSLFPMSRIWKPIYHPIFFHSSRGQQSKYRSPDISLSSHWLQVIRENTEAFPDYSWDVIFLLCPGSAPQPPSGGTHPLPEGPLVRCLKHLNWLLSMWSTSHRISSGEVSHHSEKVHYCHLYLFLVAWKTKPQGSVSYKGLE